MRHCFACGQPGHYRTTCPITDVYHVPKAPKISKRGHWTRPPSKAKAEIEALLEENPYLTVTELAARRGVSRQAIDQAVAKHGIVVTGPPQGARPLVMCKRCGKPRPHPQGQSHCRKYSYTRVCTGCGVTFERPRYRKAGGRYVTEVDRHFHNTECLHRWKREHGREWFVRRQPEDWGFGVSRREREQGEHGEQKPV